MTTATKTPSLIDWLPTLCISFSAFIFVTSEMLPVGLLPEIAESLQQKESTTGLLMTVYAWVVAAIGLPLTILTSKVNRKQLISGLLIVFLISNFLSALSEQFITLLSSRLMTAAAHAIFWSVTPPLAARLAPQGKKTKAIAIIVTATSLATILGIPLGTLLGQYFGWRLSFGLISLVALLTFIITLRVMPSTPSANAGSFKNLSDIIHNVLLLKIYVLTLITVMGHFTLFTYFSPFMIQTGGYPSAMIPILLLLVGASGILGSAIGGKFADKNQHSVFWIPLLMLTVLLVFLPFIAKNAAVGNGLFCIIWGAAMTFVTMAYQLKVLNIASEYTDVALSIYSGIFNLGIGTGALIGSRILLLYGVEKNAYAAAALMLFALVFVFFALGNRKEKQSKNLETDALYDKISDNKHCQTDNKKPM